MPCNRSSQAIGRCTTMTSPAGIQSRREDIESNRENVSGMIELWSFPSKDSSETIGVVHATPSVSTVKSTLVLQLFLRFYKLSSDGKPLWIYRNPQRTTVLPPKQGAPITDKLRGAASDAGIFASALVTDDSVYFADTGGTMYCLDRDSGEERWKLDSRSDSFPDSHWNNVLMASPIMPTERSSSEAAHWNNSFAGTKEYAGATGRGFVVAVEPLTGQVMWKHDVGPKPKARATRGHRGSWESTSSNTVPPPAVSGQLPRTIKNRTRSFSGPMSTSRRVNQLPRTPTCILQILVRSWLWTLPLEKGFGIPN